MLKPNKQAIGKAFKREAKPLQEAIEAMGQEDAACLQARCPAVTLLCCCTLLTGCAAHHNCPLFSCMHTHCSNCHTRLGHKVTMGTCYEGHEGQEQPGLRPQGKLGALI